MTVGQFRERFIYGSYSLLEDGNKGIIQNEKKKKCMYLTILFIYVFFFL